MFISFIVGILIGTIVNCIILLNFKKSNIIIRSKLLLFIIGVVLFFIHVSLQTLFGFGKVIPAIVGEIVTPIYMMIFIYLITVRKVVNKE